jgi:hypothetical protein
MEDDNLGHRQSISANRSPSAARMTSQRISPELSGTTVPNAWP